MKFVVFFTSTEINRTLTERKIPVFKNSFQTNSSFKETICLLAHWEKQKGQEDEEEQTDQQDEEKQKEEQKGQDDEEEKKKEEQKGQEDEEDEEENEDRQKKQNSPSFGADPERSIGLCLRLVSLRCMRQKQIQ